MTSSTSSSGDRTAHAVAFLVAVAIGGGGCAHRLPGGAPAIAHQGERPRVVLLPMENLTGGPAPLKEVQGAVEVALRRQFDLVSGDILEEFLVRHRIRHTGGIDADSARAARDELGADAVLITTLTLYRPTPPPAIGLVMRLVATGEEPVILWMDALSQSGDESPGLLRLGMIDSMKPIQERVIARLTGSLAAFADNKGSRPPACGGAWYAPKVRYRSSLLDDVDRLTVAVIPFLNQGGRRSAGDALALEFVRHLVGTGRFRVLEPGVVREYLLRARIIMPGGVSLETTRLMFGAMGVDLVLSGAVLDFEDNVGSQGPTVRFAATLLDGGSGEVVWHSSSYNRGDDGVFAFGLGRVRTSGELSCRMVSDVVRAVLRRGGSTPSPMSEGPRELSAIKNRPGRKGGVGGE